MFLDDLSNIYVNEEGEIVHSCEAGDTVLCKFNDLNDKQVHDILQQARRSIESCDRKIAELHSTMVSVAMLLKHLDGDHDATYEAN